MALLTTFTPKAEIIHGDCLAVMRGMETGSVDAVVTDPPYGSTRTRIGGVDKRVSRTRELSSEFGERDVFSTSWIHHASPLLRDGGALVAFCPDWAIGDMKRACEDAGLRWRQAWYWHKTNPPMTFRGVMQFSVEPMVYAVKGKHAVSVDNAGLAHNWFEFPSTHEGDHPTQKPIDLMRHICRLVCPSDGSVLDPFAGSGSTLVAAALEGFHSIGIEQDEHYCEIARKRVYAAAQPRLALEVPS